MTYKHFGLQERYYIAKQYGKPNVSIRSIARDLGRSASSVSREIRRNRGLSRYSYSQAQDLSTLRLKARGRANARKISNRTRRWALDKLEHEQWSPRQIAEYARRFKHVRLSHETVYRWVTEDRKDDGTLYLNLRRGRKKYRRRNSVAAGRQFIKNRVDIAERPREVLDRKDFGHWEADTVIGTQKGGAVVVTLVERQTRFLMAGLSASKSAADVSAVILKLLEPIKSAVKTITYDNGREFAQHDRIDRELGCRSFFATPYHSWERGTNENTNGLIRQYLPKGHPLEGKNEILKKAVSLINSRPRAVLGFYSARQVMVRSYARMLRMPMANAASAIP